MSYDHVKDFLNRTSETKRWLAHSKIVKVHKILCTRKAKNWILYGSTIVGAIMAVCTAYQAPQVMTVHDFNGTGLRITSMGLLPMLALSFVLFFNIYLLSPAWSKQIHLPYNRYLNLTQKASLEFKNEIVTNFLKNSGPQWDELAPMMLEAVNNDDLPFAWWEALNTHMNKTPLQTQTEVLTVEKKSLDDLQNDLKMKVNSMNANQNNLSV